MTTLTHQYFDSSHWQAGFTSILPRIQTHAQIKFRRLPSERRHESIAEAIAAACISYQRLAAQGRLQCAHPSTLADYAVKHVNSGRHVGGHQDAAKDVLSPVAQRRHGVHVVHCHIPVPLLDGAAWKDLAVAERKASVPDVAAFRIDFTEWLRTMRRRDRRIINALVAGEGTMEVAHRCRVSAARISQLRRKYEREWAVFQGEASEKAA